MTTDTTGGGFIFGGGQCGTALTVTPVSESTYYTIGGDFPPVTSGFSFSYPWTYNYPNDSRVAALEAKVEVLEKMLAAVLSGRDTEMTRPKRRKGGGSC